jgi:3-phosphoshikimate 1-carboxyvinyltransferase
MTSKMLGAFPSRGGSFQIEPDASSGSYFLAANQLALPQLECMEYSEKFGTEVETIYSSKVSVANWPNSGWQIDEKFPKALARFDWGFLRQALEDQWAPPEFRAQVRTIYGDGVISRSKDLGDSIMTAIVVAPFAKASCKFKDLGRLRLQECERVAALRTELTKCGAKVIESGDTLEVFPSELHGAEIETYNDHRMAMCFAILGLKVPGIKIKNPGCVKKTFPNFFQKLAGLGAAILDVRTSRALELEDLFAE